MVETDDAPPATIRECLDSGEAAALHATIGQGGTLATDDRAARRVASYRDVPVTGSIGLLVVGATKGLIDRATATEWLAIWREKRGYYAPVDRIEEVRDWVDRATVCSHLGPHDRAIPAASGSPSPRRRDAPSHAVPASFVGIVGPGLDGVRHEPDTERL